MIEPTVTTVVDEGLGNSTFLVDLGDGRALAVDPSLDLRALRAAAAARDLTVAYAADTHLHADFLTGARQLAHTDGASLLASAAGHRHFRHTGLRDGDEVDLGGLRLRALETPGHTDEHLAYLLLDGDVPVGVFTGGSLLVGAAARTDLVDQDRAEELARAQYRSLHRLADLPDDVAVWPTHGAGSFCSAPAGARRASTIGHERATNPLLAAPDEDAFVTRLLGSLGSFPTYFRRLAEINRRGPALLDRAPELPDLPIADVAALLAGGALLVDVRPAAAFAEQHVPGSLSIPLRAAFATWLGWLAPADRPLVILRADDQDPAEVAWQAVKVGYDNVLGQLAGGLPAWVAGGRPVTSLRRVEPAEHDAVLDEMAVLDVRQQAEFAGGHVPGARHVELGDLPRQAAALPAGPLLVMCAHGERATTAASVLERAGHGEVAVLAGGPHDWAVHHGLALERGR